MENALQDLLQKYNMYTHGQVIGNTVILECHENPVKYTSIVEDMYKEMAQRKPSVVIEVTFPPDIAHKFILNQDGWAYLPKQGKIKRIKKKTVATIIYKLRKGGKQE